MSKFDKTKFKKQLVSGGIYIALAAAVVTVTLNGVNSIIGGQDYEIPNVNTKLPKVNFNERFSEPEITNPKSPFDVKIPDVNSGNNTQNPNGGRDEGVKQSTDTVVSGTQDGVNAETKQQETPDIPKQENKKDVATAGKEENIDKTGGNSGNKTNSENADASAEPDDVEYPTEPETDTYGIYAKPADGYIDREFTLDELVYSPTMGDYRTHNGIDIAADIGSAVRAVSSGVVEDVYYDSFYGHTVVINHGDGVLAYYMNLSESIPQGIVKGAAVNVGQTIGGVGESAVIESADAAHLHLSMTRDGKYIDPGEYLRG